MQTNYKLETLANDYDEEHKLESAVIVETLFSETQDYEIKDIP